MKKVGTLILAIGLVLGLSGCKTETEEVTLEKIEITAQPCKTEYMVGEELDTTGLEVTAIYSDESTKVVTGWTTTGYDKTKAGEQTVEVSYTEDEITKTVGFTVTVKEKSAELENEPQKEPEKKPGNEPEKEPPKVELTKIEITTEPSKTEYFVGEELDTTGLEVTATYSDETTKDVTAEATTSGFDSSAVTESQTITITYGGKTATFTVEIKQGYSFRNAVKTISSGTTGSYGTDKATYVEFGDWPQDVVPEADVATLGLETSKDKITRGYMEFVQGLDGNYYVKCEENACGAGYKYKNDNSDVGQDGTTSRWFKVMPIKWRVADEAYIDASGNSKGILLVAENILTANVPYYDLSSDRDIGGSIVKANNYMHSQIRAYLNGISYQGQSAEQIQWNNKGFLQTAFTSTAIDSIITTKVDNSEDSTTDKDSKIKKATNYACDPTDDKIFLLSEYEVTEYIKSAETYSSFGIGDSRIRITTDFAKANNAFQDTTDGCGGHWWLRSPYYQNADKAYYVKTSGKSNDSILVNTPYLGVVPALCIAF